MTLPQVDRPQLPADYGVPVTTEDLLPWGHVVERLARAEVYWIATVRSNNRPHTSPVWGVWLDDTLYFDGSPETQRGKNMAQNPWLSVHIESGGAGKDVVILEGKAEQIYAKTWSDGQKARLAAAYSEKYRSEGYSPEPTTWDNGGLYEVRPRLVLAWTKFNVDPTRWRFPER